MFFYCSHFTSHFFLVHQKAKCTFTIYFYRPFLKMNHLFPIPQLGPPIDETEEEARNFIRPRNDKLPCQPIKTFSDEERDNFYQMITDVIQSDEFSQCTNYREQVGVLCTALRENVDIPVPYERIGSIFNLPKSAAAIREQYIKYKNGTRANGRPSLLDENEMQLLKELIMKKIDEEGFPTYEDVSDMIIEHFGKYLAIASIRGIIKKMPEFTSATAVPMEQGRYDCPFQDIETYYNILDKALDKVPIGWLFNLDETGQQDFVDAREKKVIVPSCRVHERNVYPVDRNGKRCTALHCIASDGKFLKPLMVLPRKTVDVEVFDELSPDDVMLEESPTGFINTEIFCHWFDQVFIPYVQKKREYTEYDGPAVLIMDGFIAHHKCVEEQSRKNIIDELKIQVLFLPPHSSDQIQPLDLVTFNFQKLWKKKCKFLPFYSYQTKQILETYNSLLMASTPHYIKAAFERAGIHRTRLEIINGERKPQFHIVSVKFNDAVRNARLAQLTIPTQKNKFSEIEKIKDEKMIFKRKTIPISFLKQ